MSSKTHLRMSMVPLKEGQPYRAQCGYRVLNSHLAFRTEVGGEEVKGLSTILFCARCITRALNSNKGRRYVYGIQVGQEAKQEEGEA